jgi:hypothetical protein
VRRSIAVDGSLGASVTIVHADGRRDSSIELLTGSKSTSHTRVTSDGLLLSFDASGSDESDTPIDEHFFLEGSRATWKTATEQGSVPLARPAFYVPLARDVDAFALLVEAVLGAGGSLPLLPEGEAHAERVREKTVRRPDGASVHLAGWSITGLSLSPAIAWVDDAGAFWGSFFESEAVVPAGWESAIDLLVGEANALERDRVASLMARIADEPPAAGLAITRARVLDVLAKRWIPDALVVIKGAAIVSVGPAAKGAIPAGAEVIDAAGKALLPGFWGARAKLDPIEATIDLASGITTVGPGAGNRAEDAAAIGSPWQTVAFRLPPQARRRGLAGATGSIGGLLFPRELELQVSAGAAAADVIARATIGAARAAKKDRTTGSVTAGKSADLVLIDGDPLRDVADVRYVVKVVRRGVVYDAAPLFESLGIEPASRPRP